jgi:hypothetical protein
MASLDVTGATTIDWQPRTNYDDIALLGAIAQIARATWLNRRLSRFLRLQIGGKIEATIKAR